MLLSGFVSRQENLKSTLYLFVLPVLPKEIRFECKFFFSFFHYSTAPFFSIVRLVPTNLTLVGLVWILAATPISSTFLLSYEEVDVELVVNEMRLILTLLLLKEFTG